jgi:DNA polymerase-3 subunit delta'
MQFDQIVAQEEVKHHLKDLVRKNRLSHALLFLGREGSGSLPLAIAFAQYIFCEKVNPGLKNKEISLFGDEKPIHDQIILEDSCGKCSSCLKVNQLIHPDLHFSYPSLKKDSKHDRVLSTDYIAEWREFIHRFPYNTVADWLNFLKQNSRSKIKNP